MDVAETTLQVTNQVGIPLAEIDLQAIRAQGAGGQHGLHGLRVGGGL